MQKSELLATSGRGSKRLRAPGDRFDRPTPCRSGARSDPEAELVDARAGIGGLAAVDPAGGGGAGAQAEDQGGGEAGERQSLLHDEASFIALIRDAHVR